MLAYLLVFLLNQVTISGFAASSIRRMMKLCLPGGSNLKRLRLVHLRDDQNRALSS
jgi:hypothetical protein